MNKNWQKSTSKPNHPSIQPFNFNEQNWQKTLHLALIVLTINPHEMYGNQQGVYINTMGIHDFYNHTCRPFDHAIIVSKD